MKDQKDIQMNADERDGFVTKQDMAIRFKRTPRTIEHWMRTGILPFFKVGRSVLFRLDDVDRHFEKHFRCVKKPALAVCRNRTPKPASAKVGTPPLVQETIGGVITPVGDVRLSKSPATAH